MGNLGRAGYGASVEGLWPYTYDSCDVGTLANQTFADGSGPDAALTTGDPSVGGTLVRISFFDPFYPKISHLLPVVPSWSKIV